MVIPTFVIVPAVLIFTFLPYRAVEGLEGTHLAGNGGVVGEGLQGALLQVGGEHLVGVEGLGHRVGHHLAPEQFSEGDAHVLPQGPAQVPDIYPV